MIHVQESYKADVEFTRDDLEVMTNATNYNRWLFQKVERAIIPGNILEIGAGVGNLSQFILNANRGHQTFLLEPNAICLQQLKQRFLDRTDITFIDGMFPNLFVDQLERYAGTFSSILMFNVLEHIDNDRGALQIIGQLLQPGGHFLMVVPAMPKLYGEIDSRLGHYRRYTKRTFRQVLIGSDLQIRQLDYMNIVGAVGWFVNFVVLRRNSQSSGQVKVFDNIITPVQSRMERIIPPPFGQSLVVVAEKVEHDGASKARI